MSSNTLPLSTTHLNICLPSQQRVAMVVLQCFGPEIIRRLLTRFEESLKTGSLSTYLRPELKNILLKQIPILRYSVTILHRIHLATFYLSGSFYHISKRITGINYVSLKIQIPYSLYWYLYHTVS